MKKVLAVSVMVLLLTACSQASPENSAPILPEAKTEVSATECLTVENIANVIEENVAGFDGDPNPTDIWVYPQFRYSNDCDQDIIGLKGSISFQDVVGDEIFSGDWTEDTTIPAGTYLDSDPQYGYDFNEFEDAHGLLLGRDASKTNTVFTLETIVFEDGTKVDR
jgi:hypothetical protein